MGEIVINEYRGVRKLLGADAKDDDNGYKGGVWKRLFGIQGVVVTPNESSETHYYDNMAAIQITAEGAIDVAMTVSVPELKTKAWIDGKTVSSATGAYISTPSKKGYKAVAFIGKRDDGIEELNIFYKGKFTGGETTHNTEDDGTEATNVPYSYGAIYTVNNIAKDEDGNPRPCNRYILPLIDPTWEEEILGKFTNGESDKNVMTPNEIEELIGTYTFTVSSWTAATKLAVVSEKITEAQVSMLAGKTATITSKESGTSETLTIKEASTSYNSIQFTAAPSFTPVAGDTIKI